ncbi:conserved exported hypothetical protein [Vibrio rotiferianus]|uniref:DUF3261 domain-containing protein n=1 Tax=Vibrio rotiferianus TaxID=190895 RepID=UPI002895CBBC|nr:conserved exported hypothetical protein [Vibrio rotiferianus]
MSTSTAMRIFIAMIFVTALNACSLVPKQSTPSVEIEKDVAIALPAPNNLGYQLTASQLITATWTAGGKERQEQLPVQLQVSSNDVILAGFSSWGTRILSLNYNGEQIKTEVLAGLDGTLPKPEQVLFNLMLTLWPSSAWEAPLNKVKWKIIDDEYSRTVFNSDGEKIIDIHYENRDKLKGKISFNHLQHPFSISIQTLQYQLN